MYGIFRESLVMAQNYFGNPLWFLLYAACVVYLFVREKDKTRRILLLYVPLALLVLFLLPPVRMVYVAVFDEGNTYYRLLWLLPFCITLAYTGAKVFAKHKSMGLVICCALVVLCGKPVYTSVYMHRAENLYHLPQVAVDLCDIVLEDAGITEPDDRVYAAFPGDLVHYVRQYDARIVMPFGREMVEPAWNHWNNVYTVMEEDAVINVGILTNLLQENSFDYLVLRKDHETDRDPEAYAYDLIGEKGDYLVYRYNQSK